MTTLTVATTFGVFPPQGGGQSRIFGLYRTLARRGIGVEVVSLVGQHEPGGEREIAPGVREVRVPATPAFASEQATLEASVGVPVTDIAFSLFHDLVPEYGEALAGAASRSAAVVSSHPYAHPALDGLPAARIHESHNVEADLKASMYPETEDGCALARAVGEVEGAACTQSDLVVACSAADAARLGELYGIDAAAVAIVPNGIAPGAVDYVDAARRAAYKQAVGLGDAYQAMFIGSQHEPNVVAVRDIMAAAGRLPDVRFTVVGGAGDPFALEQRPDNVDLCGRVPDGFLRSLLRLADLALNPMRSGSGTNLKMLDYALAGVPILSTTVGARGLGFEPGVHYHAFAPDALAEAVPQARAHPPDVEAARDHVLSRFSWDMIVAGWLEQPDMRALMDGAVAAQ